MRTATQPDWRIFQNEIKAFALKAVKDKAAAEDIAQDVFLKVFSKIDQLKDGGKLSAWIYQITRNTITDHFRKNKKIPAPEDFNFEDDNHALNDCVAGCLRQMLQTLPEKYREAFQLTEIENLSQIQLTGRLGISYSGVKSRVQRARQILKQKMKESLTIETDSYGNVIVCEKNTDPCDC